MRPLAYLCLLLTVLRSANAAPPDIAVTDAWVRAVPGSSVAAAYFTARNTGAQPLTIIGIRSPAAAHAMIHATALVGTQSTMRPHEQLALAPGQSVHLTPGGMHVMLTDLRQPLAPGAEVELVLLLEGGTSLAVTARVRALGEQ
jgi:periplasmic copper chaperone A